MSITVKMNKQARKVLVEGHGQMMIENGLRKALNQVGSFIKKEVQNGIKEAPKTGRQYSGLPNRSSKAGEYPAEQSGTLRNSINFKTLSADKMIIGLSAPYALRLESTLDRKLLEFTIEKHVSKIRDIIRKNVNGELS